MASMKRIPLLVAFAATLCAGADEPAIPISGAELGAWTQDYAAATNAAATDGKPVLLDFTGSDWCGWCMLMENKVFCTQEWEDWAATNIYLVAIDFPNDTSKVPDEYQTRNRELSKQYGVRGYPTYIVLDAKGQKLGQLGASRNAKPAKFILQLCGVLGIDPPAKAAVAAADPGAKKLVDGIAAAMKNTEKEAKDIVKTTTVAEFVAMNERFAAALAALDTDGVPENLLESFRSVKAGAGAVLDEYKKLDQTKKLRELGRPPEPLMEASSALEKAFGKLAEAAEACGVEDASDALGF